MDKDDKIAIFNAGKLSGKIEALDEYKEALLTLVSKTQGTRYGHIDYMDIVNTYEALTDELKEQT